MENMDVSPTTNEGQQLHPDSPSSTNTEILMRNVCSRLLDPNDYLILVSRPTVKVTKIDEFEEPHHLSGFEAQYLVGIIDGDPQEIEAVVPVGAVFDSKSRSTNSRESSLETRSLLKINQMLRLTNGSQQYVSPELENLFAVDRFSCGNLALYSFAVVRLSPSTTLRKKSQM